MSTINTLPKGLQELLGNTSQGTNPSNLLPDVRPSFDMLPFWAADKIKNHNQSGGVTTVGNAQVVEIPSGEVWMPITLSGRMTGMTAADVVQLSAVVFDKAFNTYVLAVGERFVNPTADAANNSVYVGFTWPRPILYPAGYQLGILTALLDIGAASETLQMNINYVPMKA